MPHEGVIQREATMTGTFEASVTHLCTTLHVFRRRHRRPDSLLFATAMESTGMLRVVEGVRVGRNVEDVIDT